jgi:hypothetical protein
LRWKLLVAASLVAALLGAGGSFALSYALGRFSQYRPAGFTRLMLAELLPLALSLSAGFFVYRHTARRRKLQTLVAVLLSIALAQTLIRFVLPLLPYFNRPG